MGPVEAIRNEIVNGAPLGPERARELLERLTKHGVHIISDVRFTSRTMPTSPPYIKYEATGWVDGSVWRVDNTLPLAQLGATTDPVQLVKAAEMTLCKEYLMRLAPLLKMWRKKEDHSDTPVNWNRS